MPDHWSLRIYVFESFTALMIQICICSSRIQPRLNSVTDTSWQKVPLHGASLPKVKAIIHVGSSEQIIARIFARDNSFVFRVYANIISLWTIQVRHIFNTEENPSNAAKIVSKSRSTFKKNIQAIIFFMCMKNALTTITMAILIDKTMLKSNSHWFYICHLKSSYKFFLFIFDYFCLVVFSKGLITSCILLLLPIYHLSNDI